MKKDKKVKRLPNFTMTLVLLVSLAFLLSSCRSNRTTHMAGRVWEAYVQAVRAGNGELAKSYISKESQPFFEFEPQLQKNYLDSKLTLIKEEDSGDFIKLEVLAEKNGKQTALFKYLVRQDDKYLFQYPFLIFARDWPKKISQHFIIHSQSFSEKLLKESQEDSVFLDPAVLEEFYRKISNLIGIDYPKPIDYYFCQNKEQAGELAGQREILWNNIGSCVISTKRYDFSEITIALTRMQRKPTDFLYYGILGYAELERARIEKAPSDRVNITIGKYFQGLKDHPMLSLLENQRVEDESQRLTKMYSVGGSLIDYLIEKFGQDKFRALYNSSWTTQEFRDGILTIYGTNVESLEVELIKKYEKYFQKGQNGERG